MFEGRSANRAACLEDPFVASLDVPPVDFRLDRFVITASPLRCTRIAKASRHSRADPALRERVALGMPAPIALDTHPDDYRDPVVS